MLQSAIIDRCWVGRISGSPERWKKIIGVGIVSIMEEIRASGFFNSITLSKIPRHIREAKIE